MLSLTSLPKELFASLFPFLTGFDLLRLSHVSTHFLHGLLDANSDVWRQRLSDASLALADTMSWKQFYCTRVSLRFVGVSNTHEREGALEIHNFSLDAWETESFAWDLWFALLPVDATTLGSRVGGVLLGAQSEDWQDEWTPETYETFAFVSPEGNLECSVSDDHPVIATNLALHRWYHLALTFENDGEVGTQSVYLNGQCIHSMRTSVAAEWEGLYYWQLASGFVGLADASKKPPSLKGWYDFNGVIDSFRVYDTCLSSEAISQLAACGPPPQEPVWSFDPSELAMFGTAIQVHCTRPIERICVLLSDTHEAPVAHSPKRQKPNAAEIIVKDLPNV